MNIQERLFSLQDIKYRDFQVKLIPGYSVDDMIGVRTPELKKLAKELVRNNEYEEFISKLPHRYFDEKQLHAFIISELKDYDKVIIETERFLHYVDNWATCDQLSPKIFRKNTDKLMIKIKEWIKSERTYTIRFGVGMLMQYFLDDKFNPEQFDLVIGIESEEYYVNMMRAWYFATALAKQYEFAVKVIEEHRLDKWTHNKTIQKARESYRISDDKKECLNSMKMK